MVLPGWRSRWLQVDGLCAFLVADRVFGEPEEELGSLAVIALDPDLTAVALDQVPCQPEAEPRSFDPGVAGAFDAKELSERLGEVLRGDPQPLGGDRDLHAPVLRAAADGDL